MLYVRVLTLRRRLQCETMLRFCSLPLDSIPESLNMGSQLAFREFDDDEHAVHAEYRGNVRTADQDS